jgi:hypothetical protein
VEALKSFGQPAQPDHHLRKDTSQDQTGSSCSDKPVEKSAEELPQDGRPKGALTATAKQAELAGNSQNCYLQICGVSVIQTQVTNLPAFW